MSFKHRCTVKSVIRLQVGISYATSEPMEPTPGSNLGSDEHLPCLSSGGRAGLRKDKLVSSVWCAGPNAGLCSVCRAMDTVLVPKWCAPQPEPDFDLWRLP